MMPIRANIVGPSDVATRIKASIAASHSAALGSRVMYRPASSSVTSWRPRGKEIDSSKRRCQPRSAKVVDGIAQALHGEFDILRLQLAPVLDFGLVALFREALQVFRGKPPGGRALLGELLADERVLKHALLKRDQSVRAIRKTAT
jgi:hypothetical protein